MQLTPATRDGGYDIFAVSPLPTAGVKSHGLIECKKYKRENKVGIDVVRGLYAVKMDLRVATLLMATTSHFSSAVQKYKASRYDLELRDYEGMVEWLNTYRPNPGGRLYIKDHRLVLPGDPEYREPKKA